MSPAEIVYVSQDGIRWALRQIQIHDIPRQHRMLLINLASHADSEGWLKPGQSRLARMTKICLRTTYRGIQWLRDAGIIEVRRRGDKQPNEYFLHDWDQLNQSKLGDLQLEIDLAESDRTPESDRKKCLKKVYDRTPRSPIPIGLPGVRSIEEDSSRRLKRKKADLRSASAQADAKRAGLRPAPSPQAAPARPVRVSVKKRPADALPTPGALVESYNQLTDASPLQPFRDAITRATAIMLTRAIQHTALAGDLALWQRYCKWASHDRLLRGERGDNGYPGTLRQLCAIGTIERWQQVPCSTQVGHPSEPTCRKPSPLDLVDWPIAPPTLWDEHGNRTYPTLEKITRAEFVRRTAAAQQARQERADSLPDDYIDWCSGPSDTATVASRPRIDQERPREF